MNKIKSILKNKIFIICSIVIVSILLIILALYFIIVSNFKINGESRVYLNYNEEYIEKGASLKILGLNLSNKIKTNSDIKDKTIGSYKVKYKFKYLFFTIEKIRYVNIIDKESPKIVLTGENSATICPNVKYEEEGYEAFDEHDGDLTDKVIVTETEEGITYEVSDQSGNKEKVLRSIVKEDKEAPVISLKGTQTVYVRKGASYNEMGYSVIDNCDADLSVDVKSNINTNADGKYYVTYTSSDKSGNTATVQRSVVVYTDDKIGVVYLTFDDGPSGSGSTELILNVLKEEGVKATFFVTGYGPDSLIKREFDEGHTVALHTNTHEYGTIYSSVEAYYNDLNTIKNRVYNITGTSTNIIRFPGGSNNTVSNRYYPGIMDILTKDVVEKGYIYFDWNVSSGDAGICTTSSCVYGNVVNYLSKNRINIVLMHDSKMYTANAVRDIISYCKANGYTFQVIDQSTPQIRFK